MENLQKEWGYQRLKSYYSNFNLDLNNISNCDCMTVYVGKDGITAGNPDCTIAGRIISDNATYDAILYQL